MRLILLFKNNKRFEYDFLRLDKLFKALDKFLLSNKLIITNLKSYLVENNSEESNSISSRSANLFLRALDLILKYKK